jgi:hypothetical protein
LGTTASTNFFEFANIASAIGATNYNALATDMTYSFDYGNGRFIGVDVASVSISSAQNSWINGRLTDAEIAV